MARGGARAARAVALSISLATATLVLLLTLAPSVTSAQQDDCTPLSVPPCTSTSEPVTTTTFIEETTTSTKSPTTTTTRQTTTTRNPVAQAAPQSTTTTADAVPSVNLLIPGDGTEGAESTTTTVISTLRASDGGLDDSTLIALVITGLVLIAAIAAVLTWRYWVATRPPGRGSDAASASAG